MADPNPKINEALQAAKKPNTRLVPPKRPGLASTLLPENRAKAAEVAPIVDEFLLDASDPSSAYPVAMKTGILGTGQGGCRIAKAFWDLGYRRVGAFNTTETDFAGLPDEMPQLSLQIGGAAKDAKWAAQSLEGRDNEVWDLMSRSWGKDVDLVLITASLGGGTGSGTAGKLVQLARAYLRSIGRPERVGVIISIPAVNEGQRQARNTYTAFNELRQLKASPMIIIDNERINKVYQPSMKDLYPTANSTIAGLFHEFNRYAAQRSEYFTFDQSEFAQLLDDGIVTMASAVIDLEHVKVPADISKAIRDQIEANVLASVSLAKGKKAGCIFVASAKALEMSPEFFEAGYTQLDRIVGSGYDRNVQQTVIHRGLYPGEESDLHCYTLVSGLEPPAAKLTELARVAGITQTSGNTSSTASLLGVG